MSSSNATLRHTTWFLFGLTLLFVIVWQAPAIYVVEGMASYLPLHMFAETFSIVVSMMVFGVAWNVYSKERPGNIVILACALLAVGLIDFAHMLSFKGMPDLITPSGPEKAINLWLAARLIAALALFTMALRAWRPLLDSRSRYWLLAGSLAVAATVMWWGLAYPQAWPHTFTAGQGLTPFKVGAEYAIIAILLIPAVMFYLRARQPQPYDAASLFAASVITILSELSFTLYSDVSDIFNLLGHLYKIVAYIFIYRAVFMDSVREPFQRLDTEFAENKRITQELQEQERHSQSLLQLSRNLERSQTYADVLNAAQDEVREIVGYQNLWAYLLADDKKYFTALAASGPESDSVMSEEETARLTIEGDHMLEEIANAKEIVIVPDAQTDERVNKEIVAHLGSRTIVNVPIILFEQHMGTVGMGTFGEEGVHVPSVAEKKYLMALASHMAAAIDRIHSITELKKAEESLFDAQQMFRSLVENSPDIIVRYDRDCRRTYVNPTYLKVSQMPQQALLGSAPVQRSPLPSSSAATLQELLRKVLDHGVVEAVDLAWPMADNIDHWYNVYAFPEFNREGKIASVMTVSRDITERKQAELKLRDSEQAFRTLSENSPDVIVRYDREGRRIYVNPEFERVNHISAQEIYGKKPLELSTELKPKAGEFTKQLMAAMESGITTKVDLSWINKDGKLVCWFVRVVPEFDSDGKVVSALTIWSDITERKQAEEELIESEERFRSLVEQSPLSIQVISPEGRTLRINHAFENLWGINLETLENYNLLDDQQLVRLGLMPYIQRAFSGESSAIPAAEYDTKNSLGVGQKRYVQANIYPVKDKSGNIRQVILVHEDITKRMQAEAAFRESELRLRMLVQTIPDLIWLKDIQGRYLFCNPAFERFFGKKEADIVGKTDYDFVDREMADFFRTKDQAAIAAGKPSINNEWINFASDGHRALVQTTKVPMRTADGELIGVLGIARDITELKQAEDEIRALNRNLEQRVAERTTQLEALNNELEAFSYSVSHDLRTPLRAIDGFSHILLDDYADKLDEEGRRLLNVVRVNTGRMGQLIDDILKFSRTGRVELTSAEIDMEKMAHAVFEELQTSVADNRVQLDVASIPPAHGDSAMMHQVFTNLLSNAIKFSRTREQPGIQVGATPKEDETIYYVKDNGVGFDMQYAHKLFGVFQRLHSIDEFEGTGIGLAIVKRIITRHGGRVWAEAKVNEGATIYFALPNGEKSHG